ncbi:hypothetical protein QR680_000170 [Steinernema hermaphroditum]|uniref:Secreted protein n=1 Tax=Steinernema hermaphroditum TaxID=289476 RepID=A0AA39GTN0_9BILA|nr:hypothetical protein QR680_000170 [Steinernema hermaphroditum]
MRISTLAAIAALTVITVHGNDQQNKERLLQKACIRNPRLPFCDTSPVETQPAEPEVDRRAEFLRQDERTLLTAERHQRPQQVMQDPRTARGPQDLQQLQTLCVRFKPIVAQHCGRQDLTKEYVAKCMAFFRDCNQFITQQDPLYSIGNAWTSGVRLNYYNWDVKGIPFYPINEEGAIGGGHNSDIGFGTWGGGYSDNVGVRDYWSQRNEYGANWVEGKYGYRSGWQMPLVQSLGVEGGGGTDVNVPIRPDKLGTIDVDNHYGVGGYYKHNQHTGVDWRKGEVKSMFGVGVPFAGVGVNTGVGVAFPSLDTFANALGK